MEASYSGTKGTKLIARANLNQIRMEDALAGRTTQADSPYPHINNTVGIDAAIANNMYNALNVRLEKRFRGGFAFMTNYTWSKNHRIEWEWRQLVQPEWRHHASDRYL